MSFLSKILNVATGGISKPLGSLMHGDVKGAGIGALTGGVMGGGRRGPLGMGGTLARAAIGAFGARPRPVAPGAQDFLNTFSPEDQGSIRSSWGANPNGQNDWFRNAQAAAPQPGPDQAAMAPPPEIGAAAPQAMAQDVMNARRKFRMGRMAGGGGDYGPSRGPMME